MTVRRVCIGQAQGFDVHTLDAGRPGPRMAVLGGVHGDEVESVVAAQRIATSALGLRAGRLDLVPICHEAALAADSRTSPLDGGDLARSFPGAAAGSPTERLAHHLVREVLDGADLVIDVHTSGRQFDMPFVAGYCAPVASDRCLAAAAAAAVGAEFVWRHPLCPDGRSISVVPQGIYLEGPGYGPMDMGLVDRYTEGIGRVLAVAGLVDPHPYGERGSPVRVTGGGDLDRDGIRADRAGYFVPSVVAGQPCAPGDVVGQIHDIAGRWQTDVHAPVGGFVMALTRRRQIAAGELLACLASSDSPVVAP